MCNPDFAAKESRFPCGHTEKKMLEYILKLYQQMRYAYLQKEKDGREGFCWILFTGNKMCRVFFVMSEQ